MGFLKFMPLILTAIDTVERTIKDKGKVKKDKAIELVQVFVSTAEGLAGKDLLNDPEVAGALSEAIDAIVAFETAVKRAKAARIPSTE